jgi:hypothetical protein
MIGAWFICTPTYYDGINGIYHDQGFSFIWEEVDGSNYQQINDWLDRQPGLEPMIKEAFTDDKISYYERDELRDEYYDLLDAENEKEAQREERLKKKALHDKI